MWLDGLVHTIVLETNRYAHQADKAGWTDTTYAEIRAYNGVLFMMGIHIVPQVDDYFSSEWVLEVPAIKRVFTRNS
jgi:hypothetical protein